MRRSKKIRSRKNAGVLSVLTNLPIFSVFGASGFLVILSGLFIVFSSVQPQGFNGLRINAAETFAPILNFVSTPIQKAAVFVRDVSGLAQLQAENQRLAEENVKLRQWYQTAMFLEAENKSLRELMNVKVDPQHTYTTARILSDSRGPFAKSLLVSAGGNDGIQKSQAVVSGEGLVGRVVSVGETTSRILLIADINSRVPVLIEDSGQHAIFAGQNEERGLLLHIPQDSQISEGARVITSGVGGVFPVGLPVGVVELKNGQPTVKPYADFNRLMHVRIVDSSQDPNLKEGALLNSAE